MQSREVRSEGTSSVVHDQTAERCEISLKLFPTENSDLDAGTYYACKATGICREAMKRHFLAKEFFLRMKAVEILDVGGNDALFAQMLKASCPEIAVDSVELHADFLSQPSTIRRSFSFDATSDWPLESSSYDGIHLGAIVEHVFDYNTLFSECWRVLRHGGAIFVSTPNMASLRHRLEVPLGRMPAWYTNFEHIRPWTASFLGEKLKSHGFNIVRAYGTWEMTRPAGLRRLLELLAPRMCNILVIEATKCV